MKRRGEGGGEKGEGKGEDGEEGKGEGGRGEGGGGWGRGGRVRGEEGEEQPQTSVYSLQCNSFEFSPHALTCFNQDAKIPLFLPQLGNSEKTRKKKPKH